MIRTWLTLLLFSCMQPHAERPTANVPVPSRTAIATDVTFIAISDLHFGAGYPRDLSKLPRDPIAEPTGIDRMHALLIKRMNGMTGRPWPSSIGGRVDAPRGVLIAGDLTDWSLRPQWDRFVAYYGLTGREGVLRTPVFEVVGNHDRISPEGQWVEAKVKERHGERFYSWSWDNVHVMALSEAPDHEVLAWMKNDLAKVEASAPLVLFFHLALEGPFSTGNWFGDGDYRARLKTVLEGRNVVAIFHGHHHATGHYRWNGYEVFKVGAVKDGPPLFTVVRITNQELQVGTVNYVTNTWASSMRKQLDHPHSSQLH